MSDELERFFNPQGVAVIGASANPQKLSYGVVRNLKEHGYPGPIYPVNPKGGEILGLKVYPSIGAVPDPVELAVIMVPAPLVEGVLQECGERGLKAIIIITGGFREAGPEGAAAEKRLKEVAQSYGMRIIGPNCVGVMDAHLPLDTTFIAAMPRPGYIGFVSHSGAICGGTIDWARQMSVGFSRIASLGNQLDVDIADGIHMMQNDPHTRVISIYAEGLPNGRRFVEAAAAVSRHKPVIALKAGLTSAGTRAVASHTGALAGNEQAYLAACHRAGALVVQSLQEQNDMALALATQPLPRSNRVAILTNAGGPAALAADELDRCDLRMADLGPETQEKLKAVTPRGAQLGNPVDMLGGPQAEMYQAAGKILLSDPGVDMLLAIFVPQAITPVNDVARNVIAAAQSADKPVVCCLVGGESITEAIRILNEHDVPFYQDPNRAARALAGLVRYQALRTRPDITPQPVLDIDRTAAYELLTQAWSESETVFTDPATAARIVATYGIQVPAAEVVTEVETAIEAAEDLGYPVALKLIARDVVHKADVGGVALNLEGPDAVRDAFQRIGKGRAKPHMMVQQMSPRGVEVILGAQHDVQFGPLLMFGLGGALVEVLRDVAFRLAPIHPQDAEDMIMETAAGQILQGVRGQSPKDVQAVIDIVRRLGQLVSDFPCIRELDINPLIVGEAGSGAWAVDVRLALRKPPKTC